ncbi:MAG: hypothetical protein ACREH9_06695 [Pseudomonadota bacterium]
MNSRAKNRDTDCDKTDEETLGFEISDEALEAASDASVRALPTLLHSSYCFSCPS